MGDRFADHLARLQRLPQSAPTTADDEDSDTDECLTDEDALLTSDEARRTSEPSALSAVGRLEWQLRRRA